MARITKRTLTQAKRDEKNALKVAKTQDSFQNFALNLGLGTNNALTGSTYGFNPVTRNRTLLEWIHRGSWIGGVAVDVVADDMTRAGIEILSDLDPKQEEKIQQTMVRTGSWESLNDGVKWGRLYGGSIVVMMIDGQDMSTPLDPSRIQKGQFKGLYCLDRWMVDPSLNDLVTDMGPYIGQPKYYRANSDAPGFKFKNIHYSRCFRFEGVRLPYWQRVSENLWGESVIERLYDRMVAFDSATQGAAQLAYKSYIRTYKVKDLRELLAVGGDAAGKLMQYVEMMRMFQSIEGITMIDSLDEFVPHASVNMSGMSEALLQFGQQLSGALQIPLVRLFGQSPAGLNSSGESDLRTYYDGINQQQNRYMIQPMTNLVQIVALSEGVVMPKDFSIKFQPLWQLSEDQKSQVAERDTRTVLSAEESGLISAKTALAELKDQSKITGRWNNITDEDVDAADDEVRPPEGADVIPPGAKGAKNPLDAKDPKDAKEPKEPRTKDSLPCSEVCGVQIAIENMRGTIRQGNGWAVVMPADYGYIRRAPSAEGPTEWMDCFVGPDRQSMIAYVIDGYEPTGRFDEHKVMLGFSSRKAALDCYHQAYSDNRRAGYCTDMSSDNLKTWLATGDVTRPLGPRNLRLAATGAA